MLQTRTTRSIFFAALIFVLPVAVAHADPIIYTFTGDGAGTINGTAFSGAFSFVFTSDTTDVAPFGAEFKNSTLSGTFSEGGNTYTLGTILGIISNPDAANPRVGFFNADLTSDLVFQNSSFSGYGLTTALSASTSDPALLFNGLNGSGYSLNGVASALIITAETSDGFSAVLPTTSGVPEPSSWMLMGTGLLGAIAAARNRAAKFQTKA